MSLWNVESEFNPRRLYHCSSRRDCSWWVNPPSHHHRTFPLPFGVTISLFFNLICGFAWMKYRNLKNSLSTCRRALEVITRQIFYGLSTLRTCSSSAPETLWWNFQVSLSPSFHIAASVLMLMTTKKVKTFQSGFNCKVSEKRESAWS